jgi:FdhD protein
MKSFTGRSVLRLRDGRVEGPLEDTVVVEEPLEIRAADEVLAVTMRTPGADRELAVGFLFAEGVIASRDEVGSVSHCGRVGTPEYGNAINVSPAGGVSLDIDRVSATRRGTLTTSACGVCGRTSIKDVVERCARVPGGQPLAAAVVVAAMERLRERQPTFERTGGLHAAAILSAGGEVLAAFEDIGRHNAVDKAVGALVIAGRIGSEGPGAPALLAVSGRCSFEVVQKAAAARLRVIASVSAASSLAIELAEATGVTLAGFVRGGAMTIYAHPAGIAFGAAPV